MKKFTLAGLLAGLLATTSWCQSVSVAGELPTVRSKLRLLTAQDLAGRDEVEPAAAVTADPEQPPADVTDPSQPVVAVEKLEAISATCERCNHDWTDCCCDGHCMTFFGQYLLLQPRNADVLYAVRALNCFTPPIGTEQIDFGAFSGIKVGLARPLHDGCSEIAGSFTFFEATEEDRAVPTTGTDVLRPVLAFDPFATCDDSTSTRARATAGIDFERADIDYRSYIDHGCCQFDWLVGFGYGQLNQDVQAVYDAGRVEVESDAWGYGLRLGGGAQYGQGCIRGFGHLDLTLLASNLNASYREIDDGTGVVDTTARVDRNLDRIIPILDLEVGLAMDVCKNTVLKFGYVYSIWFNVVTVPEFVESVQGGDLSGPSDTLTFDGIFARLEYTW